MLRRYTSFLFALCATLSVFQSLHAQSWSDNLIYNGDFALSKVQTSEGKVVLEGWEKNSDMLVLAASSSWRLNGSFAGIKDTHGDRALVVLDGTYRYGSDANHRLTLTKGQRYVFAIKHSSFNDGSDSGIDVKIALSGDRPAPSVVPTTVKRSLPASPVGISYRNSLVDHVVYFTAPVSGDYILSVTTHDLVCFTDLCLSPDTRPLGDVDCDGDVDVDDLDEQSTFLLQKHSDWQGRADVTGDNALSIGDLTTLVRLLMAK